MEYKDITFEPLSDTGANDIDSINEHNELLNNDSFSYAASLTASVGKGFTASLFNLIQEKLRALEVYILNEFVADEGEYYSYNEPNIDEMPDDAIFFIQILE